MTRGFRNNLRISRAHLDYLDHQSGRPLGSGTPEQIRDSVKRLLAGTLPKRGVGKNYEQSGREFVSYGLPRERIEFWFSRKEERALLMVECRNGETLIESSIRAHAESLGYRLVNHTCDKWCSRECPGQRRAPMSSSTSS